MRVILALAALTAAAPAASGVITDGNIASTFQTLCVEPFGDSAKVAAAAEAAGLERPKTNSGLLVSNGWMSGTTTLGYHDQAWMPRDLPSPQCTLNLVASPGFDHAALVAELQGKFGLPAAKTRGKNRQFESEWNFAAAVGAKRRLFAKSEPAANGIAVRISLLNLRR